MVKLVTLVASAKLWLIRGKLIEYATKICKKCMLDLAKLILKLVTLNKIGTMRIIDEVGTVKNRKK